MVFKNTKTKIVELESYLEIIWSHLLVWFNRIQDQRMRQVVQYAVPYCRKPETYSILGDLGWTFLYLTCIAWKTKDWERSYPSLLSVLKFSFVTHLVLSIKGVSKSQDKDSTSTLSINFIQRFEEKGFNISAGKWFKNYLFIFKNADIMGEIKHETTKEYDAWRGLFEIHSKIPEGFSFILSAFKDSFYAFEKCFNRQLHMSESLPVWQVRRPDHGLIRSTSPEMSLVKLVIVLKLVHKKIQSKNVMLNSGNDGNYIRKLNLEI